MKKRTITITATFDMSKFSPSTITSKEKVKEMVTRDAENHFGWNEGYNGVKVEVVDTP